MDRGTLQHSLNKKKTGESRETKSIVGKDLSRKIALALPPDLRGGWESIEPSPVDYDERFGIY
jgi:hypothetical protein